MEADGAEVVECLVEYAYTSMVDVEINRSVNGQLQDLERSHLMLITRLYITADKYCWEECHKYAMDRQREHYKRNIVCSLTISELEQAHLLFYQVGTIPDLRDDFRLVRDRVQAGLSC